MLRGDVKAEHGACIFFVLRPTWRRLRGGDRHEACIEDCIDRLRGEPEECDLKNATCYTIL